MEAHRRWLRPSAGDSILSDPIVSVFDLNPFATPAQSVSAFYEPIPLAKTPLNDWHAAHGGKLVDFAGWSMPVHYGSIVAEHQATRRAAGLFDVSHMGRLKFAGPSGGDFLEGLLTRRVADMSVGQIRYGLVTNEAGGILDDVLVYRLADAGGDSSHLLVVNASNRQKILNWVRFRLSGRDDVLLNDVTRETAMIAVQGPLALRLAQSLVAADLGGMKYYHGVQAEISGQPAIVSRTGYTGEDGFELTVPAEAAIGIWEKLLAAGQAQGVMAAGWRSRYLAARGGDAAVRPRTFGTDQSARSGPRLRRESREPHVPRPRRARPHQAVARERGFVSGWTSPESAFRASTIRFCMGPNPPDQQSAKSRAARSRQHSSGRLRWDMFVPNSPNREPSY